MLLTVREAATILGRSPRTVRAQLARGELAGRKVGASWRLDRRDLPLTERQRARLLQRAGEVREAVEDALPRFTGQAGRRARRSALDLEPMQHVRQLLAEWDALAAPAAAGIVRARAHLRRAVADLCRGAHAFDREGKVAALRNARDGISRAVAALVLDGAPELTGERGCRRWEERSSSRTRPAPSGRSAHRAGRASGRATSYSRAACEPSVACSRP